MKTSFIRLDPATWRSVGMRRGCSEIASLSGVVMEAWRDERKAARCWQIMRVTGLED